MDTKRFTNSELSSFCGQLALILRSGISATEGLTVMLDDTTDNTERAILQQILEKQDETGSLYPALACTNLFSAYLLQMVKIAEETGTLDEVMQALSDHYAREDAIMHSIRSAVAYPAVMAGMMIAVIIILLVKVMPIFNQVFIQLGTEMTGISRGLMNVGTVLNRYSMFFLALLVLLLAAGLTLSHSAKGRSSFYEMLCHFHLFRTLRDEISTCRFAGAMGLTLRSGLDPERSLELVQNLMEDPVFSTRTKDCLEKLRAGEDFGAAMHTSGLLSGLYARMVLLGIRTGETEKVMDDIARISQENLDNQIGQILSAIEPTLVIALSLIVGVILLSVMFPLMGIMSGI